MSLTLTDAQAHLDAWLAADLAVSDNQSYTIQDRTLTRADAAAIRQNVRYWEGRVKQLSRPTGRSKFAYADLSK